MSRGRKFGHKYKTTEERFWERVSVQPEGCWDWLGAKNHGGYGHFWIDRQMDAHRASYLINVGPIPERMYVLHKCDNPACVRPDHLFLGSQTTNMVDCRAKGRVRMGETQWRHRLTEADVRIVLSLRGTESHTSIAKKFNVARPTISYVCERKTWKHVSIPPGIS